MINDHTDSELERRAHLAEMGGLTEQDMAWDRWSGRVEVLLIEAGITTRERGLDGDEDEDGYSIDFAYECFEVGRAPEDYAQQVIDRRATASIESVIKRVQRCLDEPKLRPSQSDVQKLVDYIKSGWTR